MDFGLSVVRRSELLVCHVPAVLKHTASSQLSELRSCDRPLYIYIPLSAMRQTDPRLQLIRGFSFIEATHTYTTSVDIHTLLKDAFLTFSSGGFVD